MIAKGIWIKSQLPTNDAVISFNKNFVVEKTVLSAALDISALGVYRAKINGCDVTESVLNPGYTSYRKRTQYQSYDVTELLGTDVQSISVEVGNGWAVGDFTFKEGTGIYADNTAVIAELTLTYADGTNAIVATDDSWQVYTSKHEFAEIYHGETINMCHEPQFLGNAILDTEAQNVCLIPQEGEYITEHERLAPVELIITPKGERVIDFGQNMTGYVEFKIKRNKGDRIVVTHAEVLDKDGNFYNENYRTARNKMTYILDGNLNVFKPSFSFQGFRYIRLDEYPMENVDLDSIRAVAVHSDIKRTGYFTCGNEKINQLYHNTIWGQKSNYLDVPTDCPQRDERMGWTGDAQVFCRTAALNFNVLKFFKKWLGDMRADQAENGVVWGVIPERFPRGEYNTRISAAWGDAATIIPWELYRAYGDKSILEDNFELMRKWVDYQHSFGPEEFLWLGGYHYGDWLAMDAGEDSYVGATSNDLIASAFFYHSTDLLIRAGEVLGKDMTQYKQLKQNIYDAFQSYFMENGMPKAELPLTEILMTGRVNHIDTVRRGVTQTGIVLILYFGLCSEKQRPALENKLVDLIKDFDGLMSTGFVGTPYLLHVLTEAGRSDVAYKLLLEERNPSWLYSVVHGATTIWEHWNGIKEDGSFWSTDMNSFNHYAYGSVCDWLYGQVAGITVCEDGVGYKKFTITPHPNKKLGFVNCSVETPQGKIVSNWSYKDDVINYEFVIPKGCEARLVLLGNKTHTLSEGEYLFSEKI